MKMPTINEAIEKLSYDLAVNTAMTQRVEEYTQRIKEQALSM